MLDFTILLGIPDRNWLPQVLCLLQVAISLTLRDGARARKLDGGFGKLLVTQQIPGQVEPLCLLGIVGSDIQPYMT